MPRDWDKIHQCSIWKALGVTECNNCDSRVRCWGEETELPVDEQAMTERESQEEENGL